MKNNTFNRSPEEIEMIFDVMISTCDLSEKIQKSKQSVHQPKQVSSMINLERLGLVDTEALFREQERRDRALEREKNLGRGSGTL